jgi:hypothetical protein
MRTLQATSSFVSDIPERATIPVDLSVVLLWSALGMVVTALFFGPEVGQALLAAG